MARFVPIALHIHGTVTSQHGCISMGYIIIGVLLLGVLSVFGLFKSFLAWELRWDMRLFRLAFHSMLLGAVAAALGLWWAGLLKF